MQDKSDAGDIFLKYVNDSDSDDDNELCLISSSKLIDNYITLHCNHKFNYIPLLRAVTIQKTKKNPYNSTSLTFYQIQCPYCRAIQNNLLPFIPSKENISRVHLVTGPEYFCMNHMYCTWKFKSGGKKGMECGKSAYKGECGIFCKRHHLLKKKLIHAPEIEWTDEMESYKKYTIVHLKAMLREKKLKISGNKSSLICRLVSNK